MKQLFIGVLVLSNLGVPLLTLPTYAQDTGIGRFGLTSGYSVEACSLSETTKIHDAMGHLLETISSGFENFNSCVNNAPLVEWSCAIGQGPEHAALSLRDERITKITCADLAGDLLDGQGGALADAAVNIDHQEMRIDTGAISTTSNKELAGIIAHELMHNKGYRHSINQFGMPYYPNTVPEQVNACVASGMSNPSDGPDTDAHADRCDGGRNLTSRRGMHACPVGSYMTGIHLDNNRFLCQQFGATYQDHEESIDSSTEEFRMHNCPRGKAMTGFHQGNNQLLCAPFRGSSNNRYIDGGSSLTQRIGMHACPTGASITGIHVGNNQLTCEDY